MIRRLLALLVFALATPAWAQAPAPDLVLTGQILGTDHQTYKPVTFEVPAGVTRLTVAFAYTGKDQKTVVDLGLMDPQRFRGWSGGNKQTFTVATEDATMSYLPGPLPAGRWTLLLGVPNARPGSTATFEARIFLQRDGGAKGFDAAPLRTGPAWYRGDLHLHTGHSDGSCQSQAGTRVPCPLYRTAEAASALGLDFVAITDHNTTSHFDAMAQIQPAFDKLLLIPGREVTTFQGHANVIGPTGFIDFRLADPAVPNIRALQDAVTQADGLLSINHPTAPSGELCMGCGWTAVGTDYGQVQAIEVANGGSERAQGGAEGPLSGIPFWEAQLTAGHRITAIGGSDNHDAGLARDIASAIGRPTTVVWAKALSTPDLLAGLRSGRVFIDLDPTAGRQLDLTARSATGSAVMGEVLSVKANAVITFTAHVAEADANRIEIVRDSKVVKTAISKDGVFRLAAGKAPGWVRLNLRDPAGRLLAIGNPIYLRP